MYPLWPASWPVWLRKLLPYARRFANGASAHDWLYQIGGNESDRRKADWIFFDECLESIDYDCVNFTSSYVQFLFALLYFLLVRCFGWAFFSYRETCANPRKR